MSSRVVCEYNMNSRFPPYLQVVLLPHPRQLDGGTFQIARFLSIGTLSIITTAGYHRCTQTFHFGSLYSVAQPRRCSPLRILLTWNTRTIGQYWYPPPLTSIWAIFRGLMQLMMRLRAADHPSHECIPARKEEKGYILTPDGKTPSTIIATTLPASNPLMHAIWTCRHTSFRDA